MHKHELSAEQIIIEQIKEHFYLLRLSEAEFDKTFPQNLFKINGFSTAFRLDRNSNSLNIILFVCKNIPVKLMSSQNTPKEEFYIDINLRKQK